MSRFRTDEEQVAFLSKRIQRLETTLERLETLGLTSISSSGSSKSFRMQEDIRKEVERATYEYDLIKARIDGVPFNKTFKETILCSRDKHFQS